MPHALQLDSEGNIWITDVGRHQVKFYILIVFIILKLEFI